MPQCCAFSPRTSVFESVVLLRWLFNVIEYTLRLTHISIIRISRKNRGNENHRPVGKVLMTFSCETPFVHANSACSMMFSTSQVRGDIAWSLVCEREILRSAFSLFVHVCESDVLRSEFPLSVHANCFSTTGGNDSSEYHVQIQAEVLYVQA